MNLILANSNKVYGALENKLIEKYNAIVINRKEDLVTEFLDKKKPRYIFFPHWSYIIPSSIYNNFECIVFHMTDLPYGRGGSPLQNLIVRGHEKTFISAIRVAKGIDTGDIYLKRELLLLGTAEEIFLRAGKVIEEMIDEIVTKQIAPYPQRGDITTFKRRKPEDGNISELDSLQQIHDFIRMLDADGYPPAFLETKNFKLEFSRASLKKDSLVADVRITKK